MHTLPMMSENLQNPVLIPRFFYLKVPATTGVYTLSLHDALPISLGVEGDVRGAADRLLASLADPGAGVGKTGEQRSAEHTSELKSRGHLVCRLLLEKKNYPN